ncbi:MAG: hypothetical protein M1828_002659, partial [Chrysothrix sp. TS-e1954]
MAEMPIQWRTSMQEKLPPEAATLLQKQKAKYNKDLEDVRRRCRDLAHSTPQFDDADYQWAWLIVNTRSFYWDYPVQPQSQPSAAKKQKRIAKAPLSREDSMCLCPFLDYLNHSGTDDACNVTYDASGYTLTTSKTHKQNEELHRSSAQASTDELRWLYPEGNRTERIELDRFILPRLSSEQKASLEEVDLLGNYVLDHESTCFRTQAALRIILLPEQKWRDFAAGKDDGHADQRRVNELCAEVLNSAIDDAVTMRLTSKSWNINDTEDSSRLYQRWEQIRNGLIAELKRIGYKYEKSL